MFGVKGVWGWYFWGCKWGVGGIMGCFGHKKGCLGVKGVKGDWRVGFLGV